MTADTFWLHFANEELQFYPLSQVGPAWMESALQLLTTGSGALL